MPGSCLFLPFAYAAVATLCRPRLYGRLRHILSLHGLGRDVLRRHLIRLLFKNLLLLALPDSLLLLPGKLLLCSLLPLQLLLFAADARLACKNSMKPGRRQIHRKQDTLCRQQEYHARIAPAAPPPEARSILAEQSAYAPLMTAPQVLP